VLFFFSSSVTMREVCRAYSSLSNFCVFYCLKEVYWPGFSSFIRLRPDRGIRDLFYCIARLPARMLPRPWFELWYLRVAFLAKAGDRIDCCL
jgi:hypothetical protein